jgi:4-aminobutyrate aminotransferase-like enzyme
VSLPGPRSAALAVRLRARESRNVTFVSDDAPIFWESARGTTVTDVDGNEYIDCTAAFGVANAGHANAHVVSAVSDQAKRLMHGMGDVHPTRIRIELFERLATILPTGLTKAFLATTGSEALEAALKTAMLATGKSHFATYRGAYHGLSFGALGIGGIERFRKPFEAALGPPPRLLDYPREGGGSRPPLLAASLRAALAVHDDLAAVLIEPIQGRAGCVVPPAGYLSALRAVCDELGILMVVDEIFTGFGRTGHWFAIEREPVVPDIICIGKAMGSGVPISAAVGRASVMDAWPLSDGEALHTSTYLGNPLGCAAALATIAEFERLRLPERAAMLGATIEPRLRALRSLRGVVDVRGTGLFWGVELCNSAIAFKVVKQALHEGVIFLQSGLSGETVLISPPLVIPQEDLGRALDVLEQALEKTV